VDKLATNTQTLTENNWVKIFFWLTLYILVMNRLHY